VDCYGLQPPFLRSSWQLMGLSPYSLWTGVCYWHFLFITALSKQAYRLKLKILYFETNQVLINDEDPTLGQRVWYCDILGFHSNVTGLCNNKNKTFPRRAQQWKQT
jgi:hypothetical protein